MNTNTKMLFLTLALASVPTLARGAGIDLTWSDCFNGAAQHNVNFDCTADASYDMNFQFKVAGDMPNFIAASAFMDFQNLSNTPLTPFWHFEAGGCQSTPAVKGVVLLDDVRDAPGTCSSFADPWGGDGTGGMESFAAYGVDFHRPGDGYFVLLDARETPMALTAGVNFWLFRLNFRTNNRAACPGCSDQGFFFWQRLVLESNDNSAAVFIDNPDKIGNCVLVNGAGPCSCFCDAVAPQTTTWIGIKALYR